MDEDDDRDLSRDDKQEVFIPLAMPGGKKFKMLNPNNLLEKDEKGNTYLHRAILGSGSENDRNEGMISYLLNEVPHLTEEFNNEGETPLCLACRLMVHHEIISALIDCSPNVINVADVNGRTPLYHLVGENFYNLNHSSDLSENRNEHASESSSLVKENSISDILNITQRLIKYEANINSEDVTGQSILIHSIITKFELRTFKNSNKSEHMIKLLLDNGAKLDWIKLTETSNIQRSMYKSLLESIVKIYPTIINQEDNDKKTILHYVIMSNMLDIQKRCEIIEYILKNEAIIKPNLNPIKLACEMEFEFPIIELLLKLDPEYDINTKNKDGLTILMQYGNNINIIEKLLKLGANPNIIADNGNNAIFTAVEGNCCKSVMKLLEAGADPLVINKQSQGIPSLIVEKCLQVNTNEFLYEWLKLLKYILKLPQLHDTNNTHIDLFTVYYKVISTVCLKYMSDVRKQRMLHIMAIILMYSKDTINKLFLKTSASVENSALYETIICKLLQLPLPMPSMQYPYLEEFIMLMLDSGININYIRSDYITPLTALMKSDFNTRVQVMGVNVEKEPEKNLAKEFISRGVNVESVAYFTSVQFEHEYLKSIKLPDSLFFAYTKDKSKCVELLIHYWWAPPLVLLPYNLKVRNIDMAKVWLPLLMKYGGIPHGTGMFKVTHSVIKKLQTRQEHGVFDDELSAEFKKCFLRYKELSETPISLRELCKYKVRSLLAEKALEPGTSLPALLKQVLPENMVYLATHDCCN